jgi:hypothetical protein
MELDNGYELSRVQKAKGTELNIRQGSMEQRKPQDWINSIVDHDAINPLDLLFAKPKERLEIILSAMPVKLDVKELEELTGVRLNNNGNAFDYVNDVRKVVFDKRTAINVLKKEKEHSLKTLREQVGAYNIPDDLEIKIAECDAKMANITDTYNHEREVANEEMSRELAFINQKKQEEIAQIQLKYNALADKANKDNDELTAKIQAQYNSTFYTVKEERAILSKMSEAKGAFAKTNEMIYQFSNEVSQLAKESEDKTNILAQVDAYKLKMISQIPIPGLLIENDAVFYNGVEFSKLNTATQILLAVDIACLKMGEYKLFFIDGVERLDAHSLSVLEGKINEIGAQAFLASVTNDEEIIVETNGGLF